MRISYEDAMKLPAKKPEKVSFEEGTGAKPPTATTGDYLKAMASGVNDAVLTVPGQALVALGAEGAGRSLVQAGQRGAEYWQEQMTPAAQQALRNPFLTAEGFGDTPLQTAALSAAQSLPGTAAMAIPGMAATRGLQAIGAGAKVAKALGGGKIAKSIGSMAETGLGFGAAEGAFSGLSGAAQAGQETRARTFDELRRTSPEFRDLEASGDPTLTPQQRAEAAREQLAGRIEGQVGVRTALSTGAISAVTGGGALRLLERPGKSALRNIGQGAAVEAIQEAPQSAGEQQIQNTAMQRAGVQPQPGSVLNAAALGGASGGILGGVAGLRRPSAPPVEPELPPQAEPPAAALPSPEQDAAAWATLPDGQRVPRNEWTGYPDGTVARRGEIEARAAELDRQAAASTDPLRAESLRTQAIQMRAQALGMAAQPAQPAGPVTRALAALPAPAAQPMVVSPKGEARPAGIKKPQPQIEGELTQAATPEARARVLGYPGEQVGNIARPDGAPFKTRQEAEREAKRRALTGYTATKFGDGFVLSQQKQAERRQAPALPAPSGKPEKQVVPRDQVIEVGTRGVAGKPGDVDAALKAAKTPQERARILGYGRSEAPQRLSMRDDGKPFGDQKKAATAIRNRRLDPTRHRVVSVTGGFAIEEYDNAQEVRGDQGQADVGRTAGAGRQEPGGGDLQQPAQAGPEAGDGAAQGEAQGAAKAPVATAPKAGKGKTEPRSDLASAEQELASAEQALPSAGQAPSGRRQNTAARQQAEAQGKAPAVSDRRKDAETRRRVDQMTPDEMKQALLTDELTGLPNRRAYDEAPRRKHHASIDVDSLKYINDNFGHEAGDALLKHVADALKASGAEAYRRSGDEFIAQGDDAKTLAETLDKARSSLAGVTLEYTAPDGTVHTYTGPGFSYGIGTNEAAAEERLKADKSAREAAGARAARGEKPQGVAARAPEGRQAEGGEEGRVGEEPAAAEKAPATGQPQPAGESTAPEPKAPSKSAIAQARREVEREAFAHVTALPDVQQAAAQGREAFDAAFGKALKAWRDAETAKADDLRLRGLRTAEPTLLTEKFRAIAFKEAQRLKKRADLDAARDPAVYSAALDGAREGLEDPEQRADFELGWKHALAGKTKSTLSGGDLAARVNGYEAARAWMRTEDGAAWFEGRPARKLQNTGADLRRWYEQMRAEMKSGETDITRAMRQIEAATTRSRLFDPLLPDGVTPGLRAYIEELRSKTATFRDFLGVEAGRRGARSTIVGSYWYGALAWKGRHRGGKTNWQYAIDGERYPGELSVADRQRFQTDEAYRIRWFQDKAGEYLDRVRDFIDFAQGAASVNEAAEKFGERFVNSVDDRGNVSLTEDGKKTFRELYTDLSDRDFAKFRAGSAWTEYLAEKEQTLTRPNRATPLIPPKLDRITRDGPEVRNGDVTPQAVKSAFGFADVGFGKWVGARQDQDHLNYAHDAFADIAEHFDTARQNIGFGGKLHFTIGALGRGKHAAHFAPNQPHPDGGTVPVINVTNTRGDGTVLHEWVHALDSFLGGEWKAKVRPAFLDMLKRGVPTVEDVENYARQFLFGGVYWKGRKDMPKPEAAVWGMKRYARNRSLSAYKVNADKLGADYWGNDEELIARAFEAWGADTLSHTNDYLVNSAWVGDGAVTPEKGYRGTPYPSGAERAAFNSAITSLVKSIRWEDGMPTVTLESFQKNLPDHLMAGEKRRIELSDLDKMTAFYEGELARRADADLAAKAEREEAARREQEEMDRLAEDAIKAIVDAPPPSQTPGPLNEDDLSALFDEAAAELRESAQETPDAPEPGVAGPSAMPGRVSGAPTPADARMLREKVANGSMVIFSGTDWAQRMGLPTVQSIGVNGEVKHFGFGVFQVSGADFEATWSAGGAMSQTDDGTAYTTLEVSRGKFDYPKAAVLAALDQVAGGATARAAETKIAQQPAGAAELISKAAQLGVKGADEALKGLAQLFGGPGKLNSFPGGFDEETYQKAKPHFQAALKSFQDAGKTLKDLFKLLIQQFGDGVKAYAIRFAQDEGLTASLGGAPSASMQVAARVEAALKAGTPFDWRTLFGWADDAFGGTQAEGKYTPKDAYDAAEAGMNRYIMANPHFTPNATRDAAATIMASLTRATELLPTQTKRTAEQDAFQQFSTVPALAYLANWVANVTSEDVVLEPSAGIGGLAVFARNAGAKVILNELSSRRAAVLQEVFPASKVFTENAEQIDNVLPPEIAPTVVVMNPPFSAAGQRGVTKDTAIGARHVEQALARLEKGGRLVAIVGEGMGMDRPAFRAWWKRIGAQHAVRAAVPLDGSAYAKYGTTFDNVLIVIDKVPPTGATPVTGTTMTYEQALVALTEVHDGRPELRAAVEDRQGSERDAAESARDRPDAGEQGDAPGAPAGGVRGPGVGGGRAGGRSGVGAGGQGGGGAGRAGKPAGRVPQPGGRGPSGGEDAAAGRREAAGDSDRSAAPEGGSLDIREKAADAAGELTDSVFESYRPQRLEVPGAQPHPGPLVESAAMASVLPPAPKYAPNLPKATIEKGLISIAQVEAVVYAGEAHEQMLTLTISENRAKELGTTAGAALRRGFFIGDGTGPQPLTAKVLTPHGWRTMGDLTVGDEVFAADGSVTRVLGVYPQGMLPTYRLTFSDGSSTEASGGHLWLTQTRRERYYERHALGINYGPARIRTTDELAASIDRLHSIPLVSPLKFPRRPVEVNPWLLGVLLGDGCLRDSSVQVVCAEPEMVEAIAADVPDGLTVRKVPARTHHFNIVKPERGWKGMPRQSNPLTAALRQYGLAGVGAADKFIPDDYKFNAADVRLAVLRGLMDTDGYAAKHNGSAVYYSISARLADDVEFIVRSLGGVTTRALKETTHNVCHVVYVKLPAGVNPFSLGRKAERVSATWKKYPPQRILRSVELIGERECRCIRIEHESHLYVTDDLIVTHNTGKGREIAAIILDNLRRGRKKHVWVSEKQGLFKDAKRDLRGIGGPDDALFQHSSTKADGAIKAKDGVLFTTYSMLRSEARAPAGARGKTRVEQIAEWLGPDFDGVIVFDEAHNAGNAQAVKGTRGATKPAKQALAVVELQDRLPNARVVYVSATGATEVSNLSFANRLGIWGPGTAFPDATSFVKEMDAGGLAAMELVARDLKQTGSYIARSLSYDGVVNSTLEHPLSPLQRDIYDRLAEAWQTVLRNVNDALAVTGVTSEDGKTRNGNARSAALSAFWGSQQRFFNQIITSMQMPTAIESAQRDLAEGHAVLFQLVNTNEAQQTRSLAKIAEDEGGDLEDLDLTPRDVLIQYVERSFPVQEFEEYTDDSGNLRTRPVMGSDGNPVMNRQALAMRDRLLKDLADIRVPDGPLEIILNAFGPDAVAEVTGRTQRVVRKPDKDGNVVAQIEKRTASSAGADAAAFMDDRKQILVFSDAGGTGYSFHADRTAKNQRPRKHYLVQPGWRANKAMQGMGRSHRSNQASAPHYVLLTTDVPAQKRFVSSIARRLNQLGALTRGQRETTSGGLFSEKDNLESKYAQNAVRQFFEDLRAGQIDGLGFVDVMEQFGLPINNDTAQTAQSNIPEVRQFLNRTLSLTLDMQQRVFDAFYERLSDQIDSAAQRGDLETGMQTIRALETRVVDEEVFHVDERTGADTRLIDLELTQATRIYDYPGDTDAYEGKIEWVKNAQSGRVWAKIRAGNHTDDRGAVVPRYRMLGTGGIQFKVEADLKGYTPITEEEARQIWAAENAKRDPTYTQRMNIVVGTMLPIWDRIPNDGAMQVVRTQTVDGRRLLGVSLTKKQVDLLRRRFDLSAPEAKLPAAEVMARILKGEKAELANGWNLLRARVSDDLRVEISAGYLSAAAVRELTDIGVIVERISWTDRLFVPNKDVLAALLKSKPLVSLSGSGPMASRTTGGAGRSVDSVRADLEQKLGKAALGRLSDRFVIVRDTQALRDDMQRRGSKYANQVDDTTKGLYDPSTQTSYIVAGNLAAGDSPWGVFLHEVGEHYGLERMLGREQHRQVLRDVTTLLRAGVKPVREAAIRVNAAESVGLDPTSPNFMREFSNRMAGDTRLAREVLAYLVENPANHNMPLYRRLLAAARAFLVRMGVSLKLNTDDLVALVTAAARKSGAFARTAATPAVTDPQTADAMDALRQFGFTAKQEGGKWVIRDANGKVAKDSDIPESAQLAAWIVREAGPNPSKGFDVTQTAAFRRWFGDSKVVDDQGRPLVVYHGTDADISVFDLGMAGSNIDSGWLGTGFYLTSSPDTAAHYAKGLRGHPNIMPLYVDLRNPFIYGMKNRGIRGEIFGDASLPKSIRDDVLKRAGFKVTDEPDFSKEQVLSMAMRDVLIERGHDGVIARLNDGTKEIVAFYPEQIKSAIGNRGTFDPNNPNILRAAQAPVWYSQLRRTLATDLPAKGPAAQMAKAIEAMQRKGRFKAEEMEWSGVLDFLKTKDGTVTRDEVLDQLDLNAVEVREVALTDETKFEQYTLRGGENYREVLLTFPEGAKMKGALERAADGEMMIRWADGTGEYLGTKNRVEAQRMLDAKTPDTAYRSDHFDEPNILAHVRLNDRIDAEGRRVLFVEEVQSDWHQKGRKEGYRVQDEPLSDAERKEWSALRDAAIQGRPHDSARFASLDRRATIDSAKEGVPDAPFKQSWPMLAMKRVLRMAADEGYDVVAWTTGEQQADRYDLRKQIDRVAITKTGGAWAVNAWRGGIKVITKDAPTDKDLENIVGKDLAARAVNDRGGEYSGLDLKVGGEGMAAFYDRMLPNELNKYVKKWGARVGEATIDIGEFKVNRDGHAPPFRLERVDSPTIISRHATAREAWAEAERLGSVTVHAIELNDAMRDDITAGQPLFSRVRADDRLTAQALRDLLKGKPGITREVTENFNAWDRWLGTLDNLVRRNPAMRPFFQFGKELQKDRDGILADTNDVVAKWNAIGSRNPFQGQTEQQKKVGDALLDGTLKNRTWSDEELRARGLTAPGIATYKGIRAYFERATAEYRNRLLERYGLTRDEAETLGAGGELPADTVERIGQGRLDLAMRTVSDFRTLKGYFPLMRFGRHTVSVYNAKGELVHFETAENPLAHRTLANDLRGRFDASHEVRVGKLKPFTDEALVMDTRVLSMLRDYSEQASGLKDANGEALQILDDLEQAMLKTLADNSFQKHRIHRKGTPGFSRDIARVIANYGWSSANFLAKMRWMPKMESFVRGIDAHRMPDVKAHLERQIKYVRNPGEEFQAFKSATFAIYMGLNVKSAMVNLTQIPVTLYPYLANRHGDAKALGAIRKAMKDAASPKRVADKRLRELFQWADHEGLTMDLYLSDLIGAARGKRQAQARLRSKTLEGATFVFSEAEKYNRRVALAAAYHLNKSMSDAGLRAAAQEVITKTQFDYGRFNRPTAFRGIGSIPLQFQQFMVNYLQFLAGNGGGIGATARSLAVVVAMAGLMGLPFAEDIRALLEYAYTKLTGEHLDMELAARQRMVDLYESFGADPEGARRLTEMSLRGGFSLTPFDISGSVAAGRVIPGFKTFFDTAKDEGELAGFGRAISDAAGPLAGYGERVARGAEEAAVSGDVRHLFERAVPSIALSNAVRAFRVAREGVDRDYAGRVQIAYEPQELDVLAAALSFTPGERSRLYRMRNAERREGVFLTAAHQRLIVPYAVAIAERDPERRREALKAIQAWNRDVPAKWKLPMSKVIRSVQARRRQFEVGPKTGAGTTLRQLQQAIRQTRTLYPTREAE